MLHYYTEDQPIEQPAIHLFARLSLQTVSALEEIFGVGCLLYHETKAEMGLATLLTLLFERVLSGRIELNSMYGIA